MHRRGIIERSMDEQAARYISSLEYDKEIFESTIFVNIAHIASLAKVGVVSVEDAMKAIDYLRSMLTNPPKMDDPRYEDIHMVIEDELTKNVPNVGMMLALGKSRNDAVATAIRLKLRERLLELYEEIAEFCKTLLSVAERNVETIFPVYTHLQRAAPATFGFVMHAYASRLHKTMKILRAVYEFIDECPLGSSAVAGTSVPFDRDYMAYLLGFSRASQNALEATASRDFIILTISSLVLIALVVSSLSEELVVFSSEEFGLLKHPEEFSATSSIMPQKRNPVVAEIARTIFAEILGSLNTVACIASRQISGYNLDLQQITPKLWHVFNITMKTLSVLRCLIEKIEVRKDACERACSPPTGIVEVANELTLKYGVPFRKAHAFAGRLSRLIFEGNLDEEMLSKTKEDYGINVPIDLDRIMELMDPRRVINSYSTYGSANPKHVKTAIYNLLEDIKEDLNWLKLQKQTLKLTEERLKHGKGLLKLKTNKLQ